MELAFKIICVVLGNVALLAFLGAFFAFFRLIPYDRLRTIRSPHRLTFPWHHRNGANRPMAIRLRVFAA